MSQSRRPSSDAIRVVALVLLFAGGAVLSLRLLGGSGGAPRSGSNPIEGDAANSAPPGLAPAARASRPIRAGAGNGSVFGVVRRLDGTPTAGRLEITRSRVLEPTKPIPRGGESVIEAMLLEEFRPPRLEAALDVGPDGRFEVTGLSAGMFSLVARTSDGAFGRDGATLAADGHKARQDVVVLSGRFVLRGRIVHADGTAWRGEVAVKPRRTVRPDFPFVRPVLDAQGRFVVEGLPGDTANVIAFHPDPFLAVEALAVIPLTGEWTMVVDKGVRPQALRVVSGDDGSPIGGATVRGEAGSAPRTKFRVRTDADGRCEIPLVGAEGAVYVFAQGFLESESVTVRADAPLEVKLWRGARIEGRVLSAADSKPIAGTRVSLGQAQARDWDGPRASPTTTDESGRFVFEGLTSGDASLAVEGGGWTLPGLSDVRADGFNPTAVVVAAGETTAVTLLAVRGAIVEGVVLDSAGSPVAGAKVRWEREDENEFPSYRQLGLFQGVATGAEGRFLLDSLPLGIPIEIRAEAEGQIDMKTAVRTPAGGRSVEVTLQFPTPRWMDLTVLDADTGRPVAGARAGRSWLSDLGTTGADGRIRAGPLEDDTLEIEAPDYLPARVDVGPPFRTVRLQRGAALVGRVVFPDGTPASRAVVVLEVRGDFLERMMTLVVGPALHRTEPDGSFRVGGLPRDPIGVAAQLEVDGDVWAAEGRGTPGDSEVLLTLARPEKKAVPEPGVVVRVLGPDGKPVPNAEGEYTTEARSATFHVRNGSATIHSPRAEGRLEVWSARSEAGAFLPYAPARLEPIGDASRGLDVRLTPDRPVTGHVQDESGRGVPLVVVHTKRQDGDAKPRRARFAPTSWIDRTDADGAFRVGGLDDGECELSFAVPAAYARPKSVRVSAGASGVDVVLVQAQFVDVTVVDYLGNAVVGASLEVEGISPDFSTDAAGVARLQGLDPRDAYTVTVSPPFDRDDLLSAKVESFTAGVQRIRLERGWSVRGVVRDTTGRPVSSAYVHRTDVRPSSLQRVHSDGTFRFSELPAGEVEIEAQVSDGAPESARARAVVQAGARDLVLTLDLGAMLAVQVDNWTAGGSHADVLLWPDTDAPLNYVSTASHWLDDKGRVVFRSLKADVSYTLAVKPVGDMFLLQPGLRPGPDEVHVRLVAGKSITGRLTLPPAAQDVSIWADLGLEGRDLVRGELRPDGTYAVRGLPDAVWHVSVTAKKDAVTWEAEASVPAGQTADLVLAPKK